MAREIIGGLVTIFAIVGFIPYFRDIAKGKTHPHVFSWLPWATTMAIAAIAQIVGGAGPGAWPTVVTAMCDTSVLIVALRLGNYDITRFDCISLAGCVLAGLGWFITSTPLTAVVLITLVEVFAYMPTARKSWNKPGSETLSLYWLGSLKNGLSICAITHFSVVTVLYPAALVILNGIISIELWMRRRVTGVQPEVLRPQSEAIAN